MNTVRSTQRLTMTPTAVVRRSAALMAGVLVVALGAQVSVVVPTSPVPFTLQVPAVLIVAGLLGVRLGAASMVVYLLLGCAGLPVFAPGGAPGVARLLGPTGGYLLAFPLAAATVARLAGDGGNLVRLGVGLLLGLVVIHTGGVAQLAVLNGSVPAAVAFGSLPFVLGDLLKLAIAGLVILRFAPTTSALL
jgi:biotin transport system substrate-specific component